MTNLAISLIGDFKYYIFPKWYRSKGRLNKHKISAISLVCSKTLTRDGAQAENRRQSERSRCSLSFRHSPILLSRSVSRTKRFLNDGEGSARVGGCCGENKDVTRPYLRVVK